MVKKTPVPNAFILSLALLVFSACITTPYRDVPVGQLSDEQLVDELRACAAGVGQSINTAQYLMATRPDPAYVLSSSSTNFFGAYTTSMSVYAMPVGYGYQAHGSYSGTAHTQYYYTDVNAFAASIYNLGIVISQAQAASYRARGLKVLAELQARIVHRHDEAQRSIDGFFRENPHLENRKKLIGAILPWVMSDGSQLSSDQALEQAKKIVLSLQRKEGVSGIWYGVFSQTSTLEDGRTISLNQFFRVDLQQQGDVVTGNGEIGTGEKLEISGKIDNGRFEGVLANTTSAINSRLSGVIAEEQAVVEFSGAGLTQQVKGVAMFFR